MLRDRVRAVGFFAVVRGASEGQRLQEAMMQPDKGKGTLTQPCLGSQRVFDAECFR